MCIEACLPPPGSRAWLQRHAASLRLLPPSWGAFPRLAELRAAAQGSAEQAQLHDDMNEWMWRWLVGRCGAPRGGALWRGDPSDANGGYVDCIFKVQAVRGSSRRPRVGRKPAACAQSGGLCAPGGASTGHCCHPPLWQHGSLRHRPAGQPATPESPGADKLAGGQHAGPPCLPPHSGRSGRWVLVRM
ncbi:hypothetical protein ABPG75_005966 [Micractinium tetrahymenae]